MKITTTMALSVFLSLMFLSINEANAKGKSYPLMCRGGAAMKGTLTPKGITFQFKGGTQGAGSRPPQPGECTWLDRGFRPGEPRTLNWWHRDLKALAIDFDAQGRIRRLDIKGKPSANFKYIYNSIRNGSVFQLHAYQAKCRGRNCPFLSITRIGP